MYIQPLIEGQFFHLYSRGVNRIDIFKEKRNYYFFLEQYKAYCTDVFETYAYALMKNHFHLLVYIKENVEVPKYSGQGTIRLTASKQLSHFLNSYAQSVNKAYGRTGPLFESPFERKLIDDDSYLTSLIFYCHYNPQLHGFVNDFKEWEFTSFHAIQRSDNTFLSSKEILHWFGGGSEFIKAHEGRCEKGDTEKFIIE